MADPSRMAEDWQSQTFRNKIVTRLDDAMRNSQSQIAKSSSEMEEFVFRKARTREEYLDLVARVLLTVGEPNREKKLGQPGMVPQTMGQVGMGAGMRAQGAMPGQDQDPINALQSLAGQGGGAMGRTQQGGMMQGMHGMSGPINQQPPQMVRQQMLLHARGGMAQRPPQLHRQDAFMVTSPQSMPGVPGQPMQSSSAGMGYPGPTGPVRTMVPMNMTGQYMPVRDVNMQGPGMPIQSPAQGSPVTMLPSPSSNCFGVMSSPAVRMGVPSPTTMLHTPGTAMHDPSPGPPSTSQEEIEYVKKLDKLSRYIEPLRIFIMDLEKKNDEESKKNHNKMKSLLDILSNPKKRVPINVLEKCEQVLLKLTISTSSSSAHGHMCQPLLDAIAHFSAAPSLNHSLYRTFGPALEAYMGPPIKAPSTSPSRKRKLENTSEPSDELPDLVQGEIAGLNSRFIVSVDSRHHSRSEAYHLVCKLGLDSQPNTNLLTTSIEEEPRLPSVPPLLVAIPKSYPRSSPQCDPSSCPGYDSTEFFQNVEKNLTVHLSKLPNRFCLTQLLSSWEMSVRKATDPVNPLITQPSPIFI